MKRLYEKSEIGFAILWIIIYVVGTSVAEAASQNAGFEKLFVLPWVLAVSLCLHVWIRKNKLTEKYGLCRTPYPAKRFLYWIPLFVIFSTNIWFGVALNMSAGETAVFTAAMLCVGFAEEIIFRGLLFKAMSRGNVKLAVAVSGLTFGLGHIVNLLNGSGELLPTLLQVCYATAVGLLFAEILYRGKTLLPCIAAHGINNALSAFADRASVSDGGRIASAAVMCLLSVGYAAFIVRTLPQPEEPEITPKCV